MALILPQQFREAWARTDVSWRQELSLACSTHKPCTELGPAQKTHFDLSWSSGNWGSHFFFVCLFFVCLFQMFSACLFFKYATPTNLSFCFTNHMRTIRLPDLHPGPLKTHTSLEGSEAFTTVGFLGRIITNGLNETQLRTLVVWREEMLQTGHHKWREDLWLAEYVRVWE